MPTLENDLSLIRKASTAKGIPYSLQAVAAGVPKNTARDADAQRMRARRLAKQQQASERVASAASQLASGVNQAASAAEELKRAATQIATGAEEASGAAQESLAAITQVSAAITRQIAAVNQSQRTAEGMRTLAGEINAQVESTVTNVANAAQRQAESVKMVAELERQAANIGEIVKAVARIADQTNLLALNAAIEAACAGKHGKGFAVLAGEMRRLATQSNALATQINRDIAALMQTVEVSYSGEFEARTRHNKAEAERLGKLTVKLDESYVDMRQVYQMLMSAVTHHNTELDHGIGLLLDTAQIQDVVKQIVDRVQPAVDSRNEVLAKPFTRAQLQSALRQALMVGPP